MNRIPLSFDAHCKARTRWIDIMIQRVPDLGVESYITFANYYRGIGWDMKWDEENMYFTIPESQLTFFLLSL